MNAGATFAQPKLLPQTNRLQFKIWLIVLFFMVQIIVYFGLNS